MAEYFDILVIDDNEDDRALCRRALQDAFGEKVAIREAGGGDSGIVSIEASPPHCVMLDYSLPGHNGIEILKRVRVLYPHMAVIMLTGQGNEAIAVQSMKEGAQDYIVKNMIAADLLQRVVRVAVEHATLQKRIAEQRASLEIFTRALAHDLKEPMRTIRSFLDRITDWQKLDMDSQQSLNYIRKAADRMNALIDTVHLYTRLDGAEQMQKEPCDLNNVLQEVQENLAQLILEHGATIRHAPLPSLQANRVQMIQLFQNLLANAIRHCSHAVTIDVEAAERGEFWQISVRDNGPGIESAYLESIFDPFKRLSRPRDDDPGLGLGLAINRKIVESYGGKIWCESQPGGGAVFYFTLPRAKTDAIRQRPAVEPPPPHKEKIEEVQTLARILLVDDNDADIELNRLMLIKDTKLSCDVLTAHDGKDAFDKLRMAAHEGNPIDLVLLDINMPGMTGFELMTEMKKEQELQDTLIVMCTTSGYDMDKMMAEQLGAGGYLVKPPQFSLLKDIIDNCERLHLKREGSQYFLLRAA